MFDHLEFIGLAQDLSRPSTHREASLRTSVSRYYYGTFLDARERLIAKDPKFKTHIESGIVEVHSEVKNELKTKKLLLASSLLHRLRRLRNDADYDLAKTMGDSQVNEAQTLAAAILKEVSKLK